MAQAAKKKVEKMPEASANVEMQQQDSQVDTQWRDSLLGVMRQVVTSLPDGTTLGELVDATRTNPHLNPLLTHMSVRELIDMAVAKAPTEAEGPSKGAAAEEGIPGVDAGAAVIRRRADVPDGDVVVLRLLFEEGPLNEAAITRQSSLTGEQVRLILRQLRAKGQIHIEGSGTKRKIKITRHGNSYLRRSGNRK